MARSPSSRSAATATLPLNVYFLLLPDTLILDWAGPAEALRVANRVRSEHGLGPAFKLHFIGPATASESSVGAQIANLAPLPARLPNPSWLVLSGQAGPRTNPAQPANQRALEWLRGLALVPEQHALITICAGSVLAAHAGLLRGRRATTHHHHLGELQAVEPSCQVVGNRVFVEDGSIASSAGMSTGIDLMLHRIGQVCGAAVAAETAQCLVMPMRRGPDAPQQSPFMAYREHLHPALHKVQDAIGHAPAAAWDLPGMADLACTSPRNLTRLFTRHCGVAPLTYLRQIRLASAQTALENGHSVTEAAALSGFGSDTQLRRAWHQFGQPATPSAARSAMGPQIAGT
jgi:transcriptional regulator GlxA family with amidase domain